MKTATERMLNRMNYLFFDIECANCDEGRGKICSFGYVLTDEAFNVLEHDDIIINPKAPFHLCGYGNKAKRYIELAYSQNTFKRAPDFTCFYERIKALLSAPDNTVFGYAPENDAGFLASEFDRYGLEAVDFRFCDVQRIFKHYIGSEGGNQFSLVHACEALAIDMPETVHRSEDDAEATMRVLKHICAEKQSSPGTLMLEYAPCTGELRGGEISATYFKKREELAPGEENMMKGINEDRFKTLMRRTVRAENDKGSIPRLRGKRICFSGAYERYHYREMCVLLRRIVEG